MQTTEQFSLPEITNTIIIADVLKALVKMPSGSVRCIVTSPPYYGLRDYGTASWVGGDDPACDHLKASNVLSDATRSSTLHSGLDNQLESHKARKGSKSVCKRCGARRVDQQLGLEKTPELFIEKMVEIFRECRRILTDDGTLWVNIGDSYWGGKGMNGASKPTKQLERKENDQSFNHNWQSLQQDGVMHPLNGKHAFLKPKDMVGIPWMLAFALRADGWYLRQDIIWHKPNPMPESVKDRCTKAHEYIFLFTKSRKYYFDHYAILQDASPGTHARLAQDVQNQIGSTRANGGTKSNGNMKAISRKFDPGDGNKNNASFDAAMAIMPEKANKRSVWSVSTKPYKGAHYATFPEDLIDDCIKAGTSEHGKCDKCGNVYVRKVSKNETKNTGATNTKYDEFSTAGRLAKARNAARENGSEYANIPKTTGWKATCSCRKKKPVPDVVLDIFSGAATTPLVAAKLQRHFVGIELNKKYVYQDALPRMRDQLGIFFNAKIIEL